MVLNIWVMPNSPRPVKDLEVLLKLFEETHPNIKVEITSIDWASAWTKLNAAAISGEAPDITQLGTTWVGVVSAMGALSDLSGKVAEVGGKDAFLPAAWASSGILGSGKVTSVPWFVDARAVYYRTDVFEKLGLTEADIATWEKFDATLKKIRDARLVINGKAIAPLGMPGKNDWNVLHNVAPWIWASGGDMLSPDHKTAALSSKAAKDGVKFLVGFVAKGYIPKSCLELNTAQVSAKFNDGEYAIYFDTPAQIKNLTTPTEQGGAAGSIAAQNLGVAMFPQGPAGRFTFFGGSNLSIFKSSKHQAEAWELVKFLTSKDAQLAYAKVTGFIPARKDCFSDPYFTKDPKLALFIKAVAFGRTYPCIAAWGPIEPILMRHFGILWDHAAGVYGPFDPAKVDQELEKTNVEVNLVLAESAE